MSGIGPIDVNQAVELLMAAKSRKLDSLQTTKKAQNTKLSVYDNIKKLITEFNDSLEKLSNSYSAVNYNISSSNSTSVTASATSNDLTAGIHTLVVDTLAQNQQSLSHNHFSSLDTDLNVTGTLSFTKGSDTFTVNVASDDSLQEIVKSINIDSNNFGVTASLVKSNNETDGQAEYRIVLQGANTGSTQAFSIGGTLASNFDFQTTQSAANAQFTFDNLNETSETNSITDILQGLTIDLLSANSSSTITIKKDEATRTAALKNNVEEIVKKYNGIMSYFDLANSSRETNVSQISFLKSSFEKNINQSFNTDGEYHSLLDLGIKLSKYKELVNGAGKKYTSTGSIEIESDIYKDNKTKLEYNIEHNIDAVYAFFTNKSDGFNKKLANFIDDDLLDVVDGSLPTAMQFANDNIRQLDNRINDENNRLDTVRDKLIEQYSILNAKLSMFDSIGKALEKQLAYLETIGKK